MGAAIDRQRPETQCRRCGFNESAVEYPVAVDFKDWLITRCSQCRRFAYHCGGRGEVNEYGYVCDTCLDMTEKIAYG